MNRRTRTRTRQKQINILHTTTRKRHSQKQVMQTAVWCGLVLAMIVAVGAGLHFGIALVLDRVLYTNPRYDLAKIEIEPHGHFLERHIRQTAGLKPGLNLWTLNLRQITHDLEKLPYVSNAKVERHFPGHGHHPDSRARARGQDCRPEHRPRHARNFLPRPRRRRAQAPRGRNASAFARDRRPDARRCRVGTGHDAGSVEPEERPGNSRRDRSQPTAHLHRHPHDRPEQSAFHHHGHPAEHDHRLPPRLTDRPATAASHANCRLPRFSAAPRFHTVDLTPDSNVPVTFAQYP